MAAGRLSSQACAADAEGQEPRAKSQEPRATGTHGRIMNSAQRCRIGVLPRKLPEPINKEISNRINGCLGNTAISAKISIWNTPSVRVSSSSQHPPEYPTLAAETHCSAAGRQRRHALGRPQGQICFVQSISPAKRASAPALGQDPAPSALRVIISGNRGCFQQFRGHEFRARSDRCPGSEQPRPDCRV